MQDTSEPTPTGRGRGGRFVSRQPRVMGRGFEAEGPTEDGVAVGTDPAPGRARLQDIRADTDRWEVYLRRKIDLFSKTSVYHTLFIWEEKTDAECIVLNT